jgi:hypothetical protein
VTKGSGLAQHWPARAGIARPLLRQAHSITRHGRTGLGFRRAHRCRCPKDTKIAKSAKQRLCVPAWGMLQLAKASEARPRVTPVAAWPVTPAPTGMVTRTSASIPAMRSTPPLGIREMDAPIGRRVAVTAGGWFPIPQIGRLDRPIQSRAPVFGTRRSQNVAVTELAPYDGRHERSWVRAGEGGEGR